MKKYKCKLSPRCTFTYNTQTELQKHIDKVHPRVQNVKQWKGMAVEFPFQLCRVSRGCNFKCEYDSDMIAHIREKHPHGRLKKEAGKWIGL